jgi:dynein heavy chain
VFENLGFPDDMTYGHRANLRKECSRFLRFAYLVDFLAMESLSNIYTASVQEMINKLDKLDKCDNHLMTEDAIYKKAGGEPLFLVKVQFDPNTTILESDYLK